MIAAANRIIRPYTIDVKEVVWWSIYDIGHSITDKFDDVPEGSDRHPPRCSPPVMPATPTRPRRDRE